MVTKYIQGYNSKITLTKTEVKSLIKGISIVTLLTLLYLGYHRYLSKLPQDYSVATFERKWARAKGGSQASFIYTVNGVEYKTSLSYNKVEKIIETQKRFLVEYPESFVGRGIVLIDNPVPLNIEAPKEGWDNKPKF